MSKRPTTAYTRELEKALRVGVYSKLQGVVRDGCVSIDENLTEYISQRITYFKGTATREWNQLGIMRPMTKTGIRPYNISVNLTKTNGNQESRLLSSHLHEFTNRTNEMKNRTGYVIFWDGSIIGGQNVLEYYKENVEHTKTFYDEDGTGFLDGGYVTGYSSVSGATAAFEKIPSNRRRYRQRYYRNNKDLGVTSQTWRTDLSIAIFSNSEHAFYVDNPKPRKREATTQGTGWFRMYAQKIAQLWVTMVIDMVDNYIKYVLPEEVGQDYKLSSHKNSNEEDIGRMRNAKRKWKLERGETKFVGDNNRLIQTKDKLTKDFSIGAFQATEVSSKIKSSGTNKQLKTIATIKFGSKGYDIPIILSKTITLGKRK